VTPAPPTWDFDRRRLAHTRFSEVRCFEEIRSTNAELLDEARLGGPEGVVAVADTQTAGRGRLGRTWSAKPGTALLVSVLLRPRLPPSRLPAVMMAAGLAAADAVERVAGFRPGLKWPNDLVVADRKLAGMLAESTSEGGDAPLVVGVGFNVAAGAYPEELAGAATSCEEEAGHPVDRAELLIAFLDALEGRYATSTGPDGAEATLAEYRLSSATLGRRVRVDLPNGGVVEGLASQIAWNGQLVVVDDGGGHTAVQAGDVLHLRPAGSL
jgi:BirA family transcriptional regulator, biotin operon repressor / biotin---[acetyl-CoA-carboxylase] ligase